VFEHAHDDPPFTGNVPLVVVGQALLARPRGAKGFESEVMKSSCISAGRPTRIHLQKQRPGIIYLAGLKAC
jgi:hypothetical protein